MENMFRRCASLTSLNLNKYKTRSVTNMNMLFANTSILCYIDIIKFNMINVINYDYMFYGIAENI